MILATVSSQSCFCWLYRASPSLAAKNTISLISVLTIWWCSSVESSLVLLEEGVYYDQCILQAKLCYPWPCFILYSKAKFACYLQVSLDFLLLHFQSPIMKGHLLGLLVLESFVGFHRTIQVLQHYWSGHRLGLLCYWMVCLGNKQRSFCHFLDCI